MRPKKHSHCSFCGRAFTPGQAWPRVCGCGCASYQNPLPVALALVPVDDGVLAIRRGERPHLGELALPGGFIELGETWQQAVVRELREETRVMIPPEQVRLHDVLTADDGTLLIIGLTQAIQADTLPRVVTTPEVQELVVLRDCQPMAYKTHEDLVAAVLRSD